MPDKRTYADRRAYLTKFVTERRRKLKNALVKYKGGSCIICGYNKSSWALDLHHINPKKKSFELNVKGLSRSWDLLIKEADKCVLICANCHREVHSGITQLPREI